ncbi:hypothetical protein POM88_035487 [Heracleum sosnowskyi]|uniref:Transposase n=1 Tax=Heracleum sosnowskyi TaxID=360622 RepID=A0AAD8HLE8_9APIA|nr:hypothetical protein POM88_035487 [Heracleum sosnowskyi]
MASQASATTLKKRGLGRGPNNIPRASTNLNERTLIQIRPGPNNNDFADPKVVKCISQLCLQNWHTPAITWAATPTAHKDAVWAEFMKRYRWVVEDGPAITTLFWEKCAARTKDNLSKERKKALQNAGADHPGSGVLYMHEYSPWWCSADVWTQMCEKWREEDWIEKRNIASNNRFAGAPSADKAKGTYKGGSISQLHHIANKDNYRRLFNERYPEGTERPDFDQELWERASVVRKNYIKGQGQKRRPSFSGSFNGSGSTQSSQSSTHPPTHTPADCVRAICADPELLHILGGHLGALDPDVLARAVAEATASQRADDSQGSNHDDREGESGRS